nr:MAG TPA: hypothetical protein [Caudoviricetes sp.]DAH78518.1 MAG TPA: hypothetical protein [Caudoviricetes sp.]
MSREGCWVSRVPVSGAVRCATLAASLAGSLSAILHGYQTRSRPDFPVPALYPIYDCQSGEGLESFGGTFGSPRSGCLAARRCADAFGSGFSGFRMPGGALLYGGPRPQNCLQGDGSLPSVDRTLGFYHLPLRKGMNANEFTGL